MIKPIVNWQTCNACDPCEAKLVCSVKAIIRIDPDEPVFIDPSLCNNCQKCLPACAYGAIQATHFQGIVK